MIFMSTTEKQRLDFHKEISKNNFKTYLLFLLFFALVFGLAYLLKLIFAASGFGILFFAGIIAIIYALVGYYTGDKIVLSVSKAKPADPKKYLYLHNVVEGLAIAAGVPKPKVYIINDPSPNAFATGRDPKHSSIAVTSGLLETLNREELEGVISHEMSHILNNDIKVMTMVSVLFGIVSIIADIGFRGILFGGGGNDDNKGNFLLMLIALAPLFAMLIQMAISRNREYLADSTGAKLTRYPKGLADALLKISKYSQPVKVADQGTAHLYISDPLKKVSSWFSTHPPIEERVKRLLAM